MGQYRVSSSLELENNGRTKDNHANEHTMETEHPPGVATSQTNDGNHECVIRTSSTATSDWHRLPTVASPPTQTVSSVSGWIQQRVSAIKPAITQQLYKLFPAMHSPSTNANLGEDSSPLGQNWTSVIFINQ